MLWCHHWCYHDVMWGSVVVSPLVLVLWCHHWCYHALHMYRFSRHSRWQSQRGSFIARNTKVWSTQRRIRSKQCVPMSKTVTKTTEEHFLVLYLLMPTTCSTTHVVRGVGRGRRWGGGGRALGTLFCAVLL